MIELLEQIFIPPIVMLIFVFIPIMTFCYWISEYNELTYIRYIRKVPERLNFLGRVLYKICMFPNLVYAIIGLFLYYVLYIIEKLIKFLFFKTKGG